LDDASLKASHSIIFKELESIFEVTYKLSKGSFDKSGKGELTNQITIQMMI
jgi:hypothetical protein